MYLRAVLFVSGVALLRGSATSIVVAAVFFIILQETFVRREERLLEQRFGDEYRDYRRSARRWL